MYGVPGIRKYKEAAETLAGAAGADVSNEWLEAVDDAVYGTLK